MASIIKRGDSFKIVVSMGKDEHGKQIRKFATFHPPAKLHGKALDKAVQDFADRFESTVKEESGTDFNIAFSDYALHVINKKIKLGKLTEKTADRYLEMLKRIDKMIGSVKVVDIRKNHIDNVCDKLLSGNNAYFESCMIATDAAIAASHKMTQAQISKKTGVNEKTISRFQHGERIWISKARLISNAIGLPVEKAFTLCLEARKPLAQKTVREHLNLISMILKSAVDDGLINDNPAKKVEKPSVLPEKEEECLTLDEVIAIREAAKTEPLKWHCFINLLSECGDRRGAIVGIKIKNLNLDENEIYMSPTIVSVHGRGREKGCQKSKNGDRVVKILPETSELIRKWLVERTAESEVKGDLWHDAGYLFPNRFGGIMHPDTPNHWLTEFSERHGFRHLHPHMFRHACTTLLIESKMPVNMVAAAIGDKPETIIRHYVHTRNSASEMASKHLSKMYNPE